ncbi:MAG: aminoglycoside 6-adenylyltransferase [Roseburia sp.]|nr:aminoglycoside 6-adenylyltransferase [Roseburia sp.]
MEKHYGRNWGNHTFQTAMELAINALLEGRILTDFSVSVGKSAKYLHRFLKKEEYESYLRTYLGCDIEETWTAVLSMRELFDSATKYVAEGMGYHYPKYVVTLDIP